MGTAALIRKTLYDAKTYSKKLLEGEIDPEKAPAPNFKMEALVKVVRGEQRVRIHCHRADDIMTAIRISEEFGFCLLYTSAIDKTSVAGDFLCYKQVCPMT